jgi:hypothetical protein
MTTPDFEPSKSVHYALNDPDIRWTKDPGIAIDVRDATGDWRNLTPNVISLDNGFRMYYTESGPGSDYRASKGRIMSAFSEDGTTWEKEQGIRLGPNGLHANLRVVCPDVIPLPGGGYRMYIEGQARGNPSYVVSATSEDGLNFEPDPGVRFGDGQRSYGSPRCLYLPWEAGAPRYRLYFHSYTYPLVPGLESSNSIVSATSRDGLEFAIEPGVRIGQETDMEDYSVYAAEALLLGDGSYRMYYAGWSKDPVRGYILGATSADGIEWEKDPEPLVSPGGEWDALKCSEPCVIQLHDGTYKMYYEASDADGVWRILSATAESQ